MREHCGSLFLLSSHIAAGNLGADEELTQSQPFHGVVMSGQKPQLFLLGHRGDKLLRSLVCSIVYRVHILIPPVFLPHKIIGRGVGHLLLRCGPGSKLQGQLFRLRLGDKLLKKLVDRQQLFEGLDYPFRELL